MAKTSPAKGTTRFGKSDIHLIIHDDISREGAAKVGEPVYHNQSLPVDSDIRF